MQGWQPHPKNPNYYYRMLTKAQIEAELEAAESGIQTRIKRAVNAALDRDHKKRLKVLDEKVEKLSAHIAQEKFEAEEAAVPAYPNQAATWVLSVGAKRSHLDETISRSTVADDGRSQAPMGAVRL